MHKQIYKIVDICDIKSGKRLPAGTDFSSLPTEHPYIRARDVKDGKINTEDLVYINDQIYNRIKKYIINTGDIAITIVGASVGDVGYANKDINKYNLTENCVRLTNFREYVNGKYLFYLLYQKQYRDFMQLIAGAAAQPKLGIYKLERIKVALPKIEIQNKIVDILSAYDDLIESNNKRIALLEKTAQELYKEWFVRFRFPGHEKEKFVNGLPEGWSYVKLGEYAKISTGKCNREDAEDEGIYPLFDRSQEIKKSNVWIKDCEAIIVPGEGTSFIPRYFQGKFNLHQRCYCVEPKLLKTGKFLYQTLMLNRIYFLYVATGATVPSLRQNNFTSMKILMPEISLVNKFDDVVSSFMNEINSLNERNKNLIKQRDLLLPRLMSGKLEV